MRYYISDCHFFHENLNFKMDHRGFPSAEAMNDYMIRQWNNKVRRNDEVVILGDFSVGNAELTNELLKHLNGKLFLIRGNHDDFYLSKSSFRSDRFVWVKDYAEMNDNGRVVVLSHYPIMCYNGQYRKDPEGNPRRYMLYGHVHNTLDERLINTFINIEKASYHIGRNGEKEYVPCNMINCFCMFSDYIPLSLEEWIAVDKERREKMSSEIF